MLNILDSFTWRVDLRHIPFTNYSIYGDMYGMPIMAIYYALFGVALLYLAIMYFYTKTRYG